MPLLHAGPFILFEAFLFILFSIKIRFLAVQCRVLSMLWCTCVRIILSVHSCLFGSVYTCISWQLHVCSWRKHRHIVVEHEYAIHKSENTIHWRLRPKSRHWSYCVFDWQWSRLHSRLQTKDPKVSVCVDQKVYRLSLFLIFLSELTPDSQTWYVCFGNQKVARVANIFRDCCRKRKFSCKTRSDSPFIRWFCVNILSCLLLFFAIRRSAVSRVQRMLQERFVSRLLFEMNLESCSRTLRFTTFWLKTSTCVNSVESSTLGSLTSKNVVIQVELLPVRVHVSEKTRQGNEATKECWHAYPKTVT